MYQLPKTNQFISKCQITNLRQNNTVILVSAVTNSFSNLSTKINIIHTQYFSTN